MQDERTVAMKARMKAFAVRIVRLCQNLPREGAASIIGKQLLRSGTSVAANYYSACRARSAAEFVSKLGIVQEEGDETIFWLELLVDADIVGQERLALIREANELTAIVTAARKTTEEKTRSCR